jgi:hypothetical protein
MFLETEKLNIYVGFEVLTEASMKMAEDGSSTV